MTQKAGFKVTGYGNGMRVDLSAGKHKIALDEPVPLGGKDSAIDPLSNILAALIGCENAMSQIISKEMNFDLQGISFDVEGELDPRGFMGNLDVKPYFEYVKIKAFVETSEPQERIDELIGQIELRCPVFRTFKDAGIHMENHWVKAVTVV